jgi:polar amino acid transport system substrate-binding protein
MKELLLKKYKSLLFLLLATLLFSFNTTSNAKENEEFKIPADSWAPFRMITEKGYEGIDYDLINEIEKRYNKKIKIIKTPWARSLINMRNGKLDGMTGVAKREEREEFLHYISPPYYTCSTVFYVKKGNANKIKTYDDLKNYQIGQVDNSAYFTPYDTDKGLLKRSVKNEVQLVRMLIANRLEVIIGTDCQVDFDIKRMGYQDKIEKAIYKPNNNVDLYFTLSKKSKYAKDLNKITNIIKNIVEEKKVEEFAKKYYK